MVQTFERVVDRKNSIIKALSCEADEADEQYNKALRSHLFNVDQLVGGFKLCYTCTILSGRVMNW